jgi:hypothetical protein
MVAKGIRDGKWKRGLQQIATTQHVSFLVTHLAEQVVDRGQNCQAWGTSQLRLPTLLCSTRNNASPSGSMPLLQGDLDRTR